MFNPEQFDTILGDDFDFDFDTERSVTSAKERIRAYSARYYEWVGKVASAVAPTLPKVAAVLKALVPDGCECSACTGSGQWFVRVDGVIKAITCPRCGGNGHVSELDKLRTARYFARKAEGRRVDKSMRDFVISA